jgi:integral membrane protein (TIGR01906 family)
VSDRLSGRIGSIVLACATAVVIVAGSLLPFFNPVWIGFEQRRAEALAWTGYSDPELSATTNAIFADLVLGPAEFDVAVRGEPVLNERERGHMRDVRTVFLGFWLLSAASAVALVVGWRRARSGGDAAAAYWLAMRRGAAGLAIAVVAIGVVAVVAFDALFEFFHSLLFPGGSYTFDPRTERLVQLFPFRFWFESSLAAGAVILLVCGAVALLARRRRDAPGGAAERPVAWPLGGAGR